MAFYPLEQLSRIQDGYKRAFNVGGKALLLCQVEAQLFLIENRCPHMDVALSDGALVPGMKIRCRAHGIEFDMQSGRACGPLAGTLAGLTKFPIIYEGHQVGVEI